jgi:hypothetical protein
VDKCAKNPSRHAGTDGFREGRPLGCGGPSVIGGKLGGQGLSDLDLEPPDRGERLMAGWGDVKWRLGLERSCKKRRVSVYSIFGRGGAAIYR